MLATMVIWQAIGYLIAKRCLKRFGWWSFCWGCSNFLLAFLLGSKGFSNSTDIWEWNCMKMLQSSMWKKVWTCRHVYICLEKLNWFSNVQMQIVYSSISKPLQSPKQSTQKLFLCQYLKINRFILIILSEW